MIWGCTVRWWLNKRQRIVKLKFLSWIAVNCAVTKALLYQAWLIPPVPHILGRHWFRYWLVAYSAPSRYLNQCWISVDFALRNKFKWNFNQNTSFHSRKCIWKYRLWNGSVPQVHMSLRSVTHSECSPGWVGQLLYSELSLGPFGYRGTGKTTEPHSRQVTVPDLTVL